MSSGSPGNRRSSKVVFVDVDDTLIRTCGTKRIPMPIAINRCKRLKAEGYKLYLWSDGGEDHAREVAAHLGIADLFECIMAKPDIVIDDVFVNDWIGERWSSPLDA